MKKDLLEVFNGKSPSMEEELLLSYFMEGDLLEVSRGRRPLEVFYGRRRLRSLLYKKKTSLRSSMEEDALEDFYRKIPLLEVFC